MDSDTNPLLVTRVVSHTLSISNFKINSFSPVKTGGSMRSILSYSKRPVDGPLALLLSLPWVVPEFQLNLPKYFANEQC